MRHSFAISTIAVNLTAVALLFFGVQAWADQSAPRAKRCAPVCTELLTKARQKGTVQIVVTLDAPYLPQQTGKARGDAVLRVQDAFLGQFTNHELQRFQKSPFTPDISMEVNAETLGRILRAPEIRLVREQSSSRRIGGLNYPTQCEGFAKGSADTSPEVTSMLNTQVPSGSPVHWTIKRKYGAGARQIALSCVGYGRLGDCLAGCFYSRLCSTYDAGTSLLFSATWYGKNEQPLGIKGVCPSMESSSSNSTDRCPNPFPGETLLLNESPEYRDLVERYGKADAGPCS